MKRFIFLVSILTLFIFSCHFKNQDKNEFENRIHADLINLCVPGEWHKAGMDILKMYPHTKEQVLDSLFSNLASGKTASLCGRNEPLLWVLLLIKGNYSVNFTEYQKSVLVDLYWNSNEGGNKDRYIEKLLLPGSDMRN